MPRPTPPPKRSQKPNKVQFPVLKKEDFDTDEGVAAVNILLSQVATTINQILGDGGPTQLPAGIDLAGGKVAGLGKPTEPTDAVSLGHAEANYSPAATSSQFDVGGKNALKGLSNLYLIMSQSGSGTVTLAKLTGGGTEGSMTFVNGWMKSFVQPT